MFDYEEVEGNFCMVDICFEYLDVFYQDVVFDGFQDNLDVQESEDGLVLNV